MLQSVGAVIATQEVQCAAAAIVFSFDVGIAFKQQLDQKESYIALNFGANM